MIVYGSGLSPFVRKVLAFANEKGIALELKPGGMGQGGPEFEAASPFRKMPAFFDPAADFGISDSTAIVAYLEAEFPEPNLIPTDPVGRARTTWYEEFADTILTPVGGRMFFNRFVAPKALNIPGDLALADKAEAEELPPLLDYLERVVTDSGFLVAERITLADIAIASPFVNLAHIGVTIDAARWPRTAGYVAGVLARPSFAGLIEQERAVVARMG